MTSIRFFILSVLLFFIPSLMGQNYYRDSIFTESKIKYEENKNKEALMLVEQAKEISNEEDSIFAEILIDEAFLNAQLGKVRKAIDLSEQVLYCANKIFGTNHAVYIKGLSNLASFYYYCGDIDKAFIIEEQAMQICEDMYGIECDLYYTSKEHLARYYDAKGNTPDAINLYKEVCKYKDAKYGAQTKEYAFCLNLLALLYLHSGDYLKATETNKKAKEILYSLYGDGQESPYWKSISIEAMIISTEGDHVQAIKMKEDIMSNLAEERENPIAIGNLATDYISIGRYVQALSYLEKAKQLFLEILDYQTPAYGSLLRKFGICYQNMGNDEIALQMYLEAAEFNEKLFTKKSEAYIYSISEVAGTYAILGKYSDAIGYFDIALESTDANNKPLLAYLYTMKSRCTFATGNVALAKDEATQAVAAYEQLGLYSRCLDLYNDLILYYLTLGDLHEATGICKKAYNLEIDKVIRDFPLLSSNERETFWRTNSDFLNFYLKTALIVNPYDEELRRMSFNSVLLVKNILLDSNITLSEDILSSEDSLTIQAFGQFQQLRKRVDDAYFGVKQVSNDCLDSLQQQINNLDKFLVSHSVKYKDYVKSNRISFEDIRENLDTASIAIEFLEVPYRNDSILYYAFTVKNNYQTPHLVYLFRTSRNKKLSIDRADILSKLIWQNLLEEIKDVRTIYFSPEGKLCTFPIEYLTLPNSNQCMTDKYKMYRLSSTKQLLKERDRKAIHNMVMYGGIAYDESQGSDILPLDNSYLQRNEFALDSAFIDIERGKVVSLPGSKELLYKISSCAPQPINISLYMDHKGSEESFKKLSGTNTNLLHLDTHAFYSLSANGIYMNNAFSGLGFEAESLIRSGVYLAGANITLNAGKSSDYSNDGILTSYEISQLDLSQLDFVVLAACQTGVGDIKDDGVFGLQRGFKKAGAKTILSSLWNVNNTATLILMEEFYKHLFSGKSKVESLYLAQKYLRDYVDDEGNHPFIDPYYWAAWVLLDGIENTDNPY